MNAPLARKALHSSERMDYLTPDWFLELVRKVAPIDYDPATNRENPTLATAHSSQVGELDAPYDARYQTVQHGTFVSGKGGLCTRWLDYVVDGLAFCNPPYGRHLDGPIDPEKRITRKGKLVGVGTGWAAKMASFRGQAIYLVPNRPETDWHRMLKRWCDSHLAWSSPEHGARVNFVYPDGSKPKGGAAFPSSVFYSAGDVGVRTYRDRMRRFRHVFGAHGDLYEVRS